MTTDSIADLLTRIRNAQRAGHQTVTLPKFKVGEKLLGLLKKEGFIESFEADSLTAKDVKKPQGKFTVHLKYYGSGRPAMASIKRVSTSGRRVYAEVSAIPSVMCGLGIAIVSTSQGLMSDREARRKKIGGEVLAVIG